MPQRDSNPQSQQTRGRRPTPQTAEPPGLIACSEIKFWPFPLAPEEISELPITVPGFEPRTTSYEAEMLSVWSRHPINRQNTRCYCIFDVTVLQYEYPCDILYRSGRNVCFLIGFRMGEKMKSSLFTPWKHMVEWRYSSLIPAIGSRWSGVVSFTPWLL